jgi:hypothetical protein
MPCSKSPPILGHTFADYDQNGALDFFVIGMGSTTMRRLN